MESKTYRAYVVAINDETYTIVSERDKQLHTLQKPVKTGTTVMPDGSVVYVDEKIITPSVMFSACREYLADLRRHKERRKKRALETKTTATQPSATEIKS